MVKLCILAIIFIGCVAYGIVKGNRAKGLSSVVIWFIKAPQWTAVVMFVSFLVLYGFKWLVLLMLIPLVLPVMVYFSEIMYEWQRGMMERKFTPQIKKMVSEVIPFHKEVDVDVFLMHGGGKRRSEFLSKNPKELGARVYLKGKTEEAKALLVEKKEEYQSVIGDRLSNFFYQVILTIR